MALQLDQVSIAEVAAIVTATVEFKDVTASPYCMKDEGSGRVNSGLSIPFTGGKFSCPMDPQAAGPLSEKFGSGTQIPFSKIVLLVTPAVVGRDKKGAIKPVDVLELWQGKNKIYSRND